MTNLNPSLRAQQVAQAVCSCGAAICNICGCSVANFDKVAWYVYDEDQGEFTDEFSWYGGHGTLHILCQECIQEIGNPDLWSNLQLGFANELPTHNAREGDK